MEEKKNQYHIIELDLAKEISHGICVSNLAYRIAKKLSLDEKVCYNLAVAGLLHDIGKLEMAKALVTRERKDTLRVEELRFMRTHSGLGYMILKDRGYSDDILQWILYHHENYDGSGYPANKAGEEIPLGARILRVCDVFAALTTNRPYRKAFDVDTAIELMIAEVKNFDMKVFLTFLEVVHEDEDGELLDKQDFMMIQEEEA